MEVLVSYFSVKKNKKNTKLREVKSHRIQIFISGSQVDAHNHCTCHIASHCAQKQKGFGCPPYQTLYKYRRWMLVL